MRRASTTHAKPASELQPLHLSAIAHDLRSLWPLGALLAIVAAGRLATTLWKLRRLRLSGIGQIDRMSGATFERPLALLFKDLGYRVERVGSATGDYGADLIVSKAGRRMAVQAKRWDRSVGVRAVQEVLGARGYYDADEAIVVTNSYFTRQAKALAESNGVRLFDRDALVKALLRTGRPVRPAVTVRAASRLVPAFAAGASEGASASRPGMVGGDAFCARCGEGVSAAVRDYCHGHRRFRGLVYCVGHQQEIG